MKELRGLIITGSACIAAMFVLVVLLVGGRHEPEVLTPIALIPAEDIPKCVFNASPMKEIGRCGRPSTAAPSIVRTVRSHSTDSYIAYRIKLANTRRTRRFSDPARAATSVKLNNCSPVAQLSTPDNSFIAHLKPPIKAGCITRLLDSSV